MTEQRRLWLKDGPDTSWDPREVWRERILRPRIGYLDESGTRSHADEVKTQDTPAAEFVRFARRGR